MLQPPGAAQQRLRPPARKRRGLARSRAATLRRPERARVLRRRRQARRSVLDIPRKLRTLYGINVLPMEVLPLDDEDISEVNPNMYWNWVVIGGAIALQ